MSLYHRFHDRFGTAGVVLGVIALIAALGGTALAAGALTPKQKKEVTKIAKKYAGKPGATGATGPAGTNGTNGTNGAPGEKGAPGTNGIDGAPGANGKSVEIGTATAGECSSFGGSGQTVQVAGEPLTKKPVCNGKEGSPWTVGGKLPSTKTETGTFGVSVNNEKGEFGFQELAPISFTLPVEPAPTLVYEKMGETSTDCPGVTSGVPQAKPGKLCVYSGLELNGSLLQGIKPKSVLESGVEPSGTVLEFECPIEVACLNYGAWAVTAP